MEVKSKRKYHTSIACAALFCEPSDHATKKILQLNLQFSYYFEMSRNEKKILVPL